MNIRSLQSGALVRCSLALLVSLWVSCGPNEDPDQGEEGIHKPAITTEVVEFEGFIDYGKPIDLSKTEIPEGGPPVTVVLTD